MDATFFREPDTERILERAANAAAMPLSVHYVRNDQEGPVIKRWGSPRAACHYVNEERNGARACRQCRLDAAILTQSLAVPAPFICHMGFACVSAALPADPGFVLTFGPFCPAIETRSLPFDAARGLRNLTADEDDDLPEITEEDTQDLPFPLDDILTAEPSAIEAIATWTLETLETLIAQYPDHVLPDQSDQSDRSDRSDRSDNALRRPRPSPPQSPREILTTSLAVAATAGHAKRLHALLSGLLAESGTRRRTSLSLRQARLIAIATATLETADATNAQTEKAWATFPEFAQRLRVLEDDTELLAETQRLLARIAPPRRRKPQEEVVPATSKPIATYAELDKIIEPRIADGITLEEAAAALGVSPSALSHRLDRNYNMGFLEYLGRRRIERAQTMLRNTNLSATEIAHRVGVRDQSHFSKLFKKVTGMTPSDYRDRHGKKNKRAPKRKPKNL